MNVKELRDLLAKLPDDLPVILQSDPEGNGYHIVRGAEADHVYETGLDSGCGHDACAPGTYVRWPYEYLGVDDSDYVVVIYP